jgi:hypothetical protein
VAAPDYRFQSPEGGPNCSFRTALGHGTTVDYVNYFVEAVGVSGFTGREAVIPVVESVSSLGRVRTGGRAAGGAELRPPAGAEASTSWRSARRCYRPTPLCRVRRSLTLILLLTT